MAVRDASVDGELEEDSMRGSTDDRRESLLTVAKTAAPMGAMMARKGEVKEKRPRTNRARR